MKLAIKLVTALLPALALSLALPAIASADTEEDASIEETPNLYLGAASGFAYAPLTYHIPVALEAGLRAGSLPLFLRGKLVYGTDITEVGGSSIQGEIGAEYRGCFGTGTACIVGGLDAGYAHSSWGGIFTYSSAIIDPRVGLDVGSRTFRVRLAGGPRATIESEGLGLGFISELAFHYYY